MITMLRPLSRRGTQLLLQALVAGTVSAVGVVVGVVPSFHPGSFYLDFATKAYAQDVSDQEVQSYARSVLAIEPIRQAAYNKIKQMTGSDKVPVVACHRPSSLNELPENIRGVAIEYCNQAIAIVERNNLTITRFNQITVAHQSNTSLADRIQQIINRIQSNG